jgi:methyl-accepting chemotaxis protein
MTDDDKQYKTQTIMNDKYDDFVFSDPNAGAAPATSSKTSLETAPNSFTFDTDEEEILAKRKKRRRKKKQPYILLFSIIIATLYIIGALMYFNNQGANGIGSIDAFTIIITLLGPALFSVLAGLLGEAITKANRDSRALALIARRIMEPEQTLAEGTKSRIGLVRDEIERLENTINSATSKLANMEILLRTQHDGIRQISSEADSGADKLINSIESEKTRLSAILSGLSELSKSAHNSARLATQGLEEKAELLGRATLTLSENSKTAANAALEAATKLENAVTKTQNAADTLDNASKSGEQALVRAHDLMVLARVSADNAIGGVSNAIDNLNNAANNAADTAKQVSEYVVSQVENARSGGISIIENVKAIAEESAKQLVATMSNEADRAQQKAQESVMAFETISTSIRALSEEATNLLSTQLQANKHRVDNLRQQTFEMNQEADNFAQNRLNSARDIIEQSSKLLNEVGDKINTRFEEVANSAANQAGSVEKILEQLNARLDTIPQNAQAKAQEVEALLASTLSALNEEGKKAAQEAEELNDKFQSKLHESYAALGEVAMRLATIPGISQTIAPNPIFAPKPINPTPVAQKPIEQKPLEQRPIEQPKTTYFSDPKFNNENTYNPNIPTPNNTSNIIPEAKLPINNTQQNARFAPEKDASELINQQPPKPVVSEPIQKPVFGSFSSVLSPNIPVRSTTAINKPEVDSAKKSLQTPPSQPPVNVILRGRIENNEEINQQNLDETPKAPDELIEQKPNTSPNAPISNIASNNYVPPPNHDIDRDWSWREVLTKNKNTNGSDTGAIKASILREFALVKILNEVTLERYLQAYSRNPSKATDLAKANLPTQISGLQRKISENLEIRPFLVRFVEERRELVKLGRLRGDDLRLYLLAEAALDI